MEGYDLYGNHCIYQQNGMDKNNYWENGQNIKYEIEKIWIVLNRHTEELKDGSGDNELSNNKASQNDNT